MKGLRYAVLNVDLSAMDSDGERRIRIVTILYNILDS